MWKALNGLPKGWLPKFLNNAHSHPSSTPARSESAGAVGRFADVATDHEQLSGHCSIKPSLYHFTDTPLNVNVEQLNVSPIDFDSQWRQKNSSYRYRKCRPAGNKFSDDFFDYLGFGFFVAAGLRLSGSGHLSNDERKKKNNGKKCWDALASTVLGMAFVRPGFGLGKMVLPICTSHEASSTTSNSTEDTSSDHSNVDQVGKCDEELLESKSTSRSNTASNSSLDDHVNRLQDLARQYTAIALNSDALRLIEEKEWEKAIEYFLEASELGLDKAMFNLGICHELGRGVEQDLSKACQYYRKAANLGHASALFNLAVFNLEGRPGVPVNEAEGLMWMQKASDGGVKEAQTFLGLRCGQNEEYERAVSYFEMAAEQQHADGEFLLGVCYANGLGVEVNDRRAARLFKLASDAGNAEACFALALCHETGRGVSLDADRAMELFYKAATFGHPLALEKLEWGLDVVREDSPATEPSKSSSSMSSCKPDAGLRAVSSLPDLGQLHRKNKVRDERLVPKNNKKNSSSVFDFASLKELFIDYWKFDPERRQRRSSSSSSSITSDDQEFQERRFVDENCELVIKRELLNAKTLLA